MKTVKNCSSINLYEDGNLISKELQVAEVLNEHFVNITNSLGIVKNKDITTPTIGIEDPVEVAIKKFESHPSILKISRHIASSDKFEFRAVTEDETNTQLVKLNPNKGAPVGCIPAKILKDNSDIFSFHLTNLFNKNLSESRFPDELKAGDITVLFKQNDAFDKKSYRQITVLPSVSKIFERLMYEQMYPFVERFLSPHLCGFRRGYSTQHALLKLVEDCRKAIDKRGCSGAVMMDLSKAFDCLNYELLIAKLHTYGFSKTALDLIHNYLPNRKQRVKVNGSFSTYSNVRQGIPQGSVLGPLLFNTYINDMFMGLTDTEVCNYADDTTLYACNESLQNVVNSLERNNYK